MQNKPVICFGQQPSGFFPKRLLVAKIETARKLQKEIGGKIVYFYHDSDADYRETVTTFEDPQTHAEVRMNFVQPNKIQKKYSPLYLKQILDGWQEETARKLERYVSKNLIKLFSEISEKTVADFCLAMYIKMGLFDGIQIERSSDPKFREKASELTEFYADIQYEGEIVRAESHDGIFRLHEGGGNYIAVPTPPSISKEQKNPGRDYRFRWMQSVIGCTHYIAGHGENEYLKKGDFPEVTFVTRDEIEKSNYAYVPTI